MLALKIKLKKLLFFTRKFLPKWQISSEGLVLRLFLISIIIVLSYNFAAAYAKGMENKRLIKQEEDKLQRLQEEAADLERTLEYYSSVEYQRLYARESRNLAQPGETLFYVDRPKNIEIDEFEINEDPIILDNNSKWWRELLLGI